MGFFGRFEHCSYLLGKFFRTRTIPVYLSIMNVFSKEVYLLLDRG
jgi:hypothetical protein